MDRTSAASIKQPVTLQISLAPTDLPYARHTLPHQLRCWANQVDEILLTLDLHRSNGRYAEGWHERLPGMMRQLLDETCAAYAQARWHEVDYAPAAAEELSSAYFGGKPVPAKEGHGAPFYAYFAGLHQARHDYVLHMDADMLYGGGSQTWLAEALHLMARRADVLVCNPLPGPPTADGTLRSQTLVREPYTSLAYRSPAVSTRTFFLDRARFHHQIQALPLLRMKGKSRLRAFADGNPPYEGPEVFLSYAMQAHGLIRLDFLGEAPGMWSIHPPYHSALFCARLPELIGQIESGTVPEGQRGCHDMNGSMIDWSDARKPVWVRAAKHARLTIGHLHRLRTDWQWRLQ